MKLELWAADDFCFTVEGADVHEFLNRAATAGVRLRHVRHTKTGCTAQAVSYTHLDVYKRQTIWRLPQPPTTTALARWTRC